MVYGPVLTLTDEEITALSKLFFDNLEEMDKLEDEED